jgi:hypothetical protein
MKQKYFLLVLLCSTICCSPLISKVSSEYHIKLIYGNEIHTASKEPFCFGFDAKLNISKLLYGKIDYKIFPNVMNVVVSSVGINANLSKKTKLFFEVGEGFFLLRSFFDGFHTIISSGIDFKLSEKFRTCVYYSRHLDSRIRENVFVEIKYSLK